MLCNSNFDLMIFIDHLKFIQDQYAYVLDLFKDGVRLDYTFVKTQRCSKPLNRVLEYKHVSSHG